ncbi:sugar ABC transporter ATP-binding protein [Erysipelothrix sp. HDW6C]|uniref:sugar ABC transporter ATP-binding protein n=1 Tax=Erysipelothrix sp. HDW6C TaxID=2714930 RepID=UPI00140DD6A8|nr:sugar ABC transporter ATP-binding protein [Erysipelothrix sp. HDW6C]QIK70671.1 sugar ABC transporter ATP-binding protein [Erysipelothrix sp. HDW6C]
MSTILEMKHIRKEFPGVVALSDVSLKLEKGEVLSLVGENGAGKSTLMKILSGTYQPTKGEIFVKGQPVKITDPQHAAQLGISIIHQELSIVPNLTIAENIYVLNEPTRLGLVNDKQMVKDAQVLLDRLNFNLNPNSFAKDLSVSEQQMVEIAKALSANPKIVIMDEPTSALSNKETKNLLNTINRLREQGISVIYISHKLNEIFEISQKIVVIRDGAEVGELITKDTDENELVKLMVGREMKNVYPIKDFASLSNENQLEVSHYSKTGYYHDINLSVKPGEILGIYGLMGSGRTEIAQGIFGILKKDSGTLKINGGVVNVNSPSDAIKHKIAFVTEDRKQEGLVLDASIRENLSVVNIKKILNRYNMISHAKEVVIANDNVAKIRIKTPHIEQNTRNLSGGNQQKVVLGKWFEIEPKILILDEPTRGIDVGSKYEIYELIIDLAREGLSIILISSDLPEVLNMSDRLAVVRDMTIIEEMNPKVVSQEDVMKVITKEELK